MKPYGDANVLLRLYLDPDGTGRARELTQNEQARAGWPLPVTPLLRLEVYNALRQIVFTARQSAGQWRITPEMAEVARLDFDTHLADAQFLRRAPLSLEDLEVRFEELSARYTVRHGFRAYDVLHVASALELGCDTFWSFDKNASKLAQLAGLKTNA
jgi:predicted nucleic acid-binding protein